MKKYLLIFSIMLVSFSTIAESIVRTEGDTYFVECTDPNATPLKQTKLEQTIFANVASSLYSHQGMKLLLPAPGTYTTLPQEGVEQKTLVVSYNGDLQSKEMQATQFKMSVSAEETTTNFKLDYLYEIHFGRNSTSIKTSGRLEVLSDSQEKNAEQENIHCDFITI
ncbi:hypothetical protein GW915_01535 [bacterium]|nr:hypothetical protein [bacterium]